VHSTERCALLYLGLPQKDHAAAIARIRSDDESRILGMQTRATIILFAVALMGISGIAQNAFPATVT
jgi:hypothetical protein